MPYLIAFLFFSLLFEKVGLDQSCQMDAVSERFIDFFPFCFVKEREGTLPIIAGIVFVYSRDS